MKSRREGHSDAEIEDDDGGGDFFDIGTKIEE